METKFGGSLPQSQWIQKYHRIDPNKDIPFAIDSIVLSKKQCVLIGIALFLCFLAGVFLP
jgi:hypothetical protein